MKKENIFDFWASFFPEKNNEQINDIFEAISSINFDTALEKRLVEHVDFDGKKYFYSQPKFSPNLENCFNEVIETVSKSTRWVRFCTPILRYYFKAIYNTVYDAEIIKHKKNFLIHSIFSLSKKMFAIYYKTLILEFYIAKQDGIIKEEESQNKADYFNLILLSDLKYIESIYRLYPELVRLLGLCVLNFSGVPWLSTWIKLERQNADFS